jgi:hypothetical protein
MELSLHHHKELDVQFFLSSYNHIKTNSWKRQIYKRKQDTQSQK